MESYAKSYEKLKPARQLQWLPHLGSVDLDLEFSDNSIRSFSISPLQASIIMLFQQKGKLYKIIMI
jgi:anaphase-promoting complex subunit 2